MKKRISFILCIVLLAVLTGCSGDSGAESGAKGKDEAAATEAAPAQKDVDLDAIDVDLTELSSTMVYSEVYNMIDSPDDYIGKTVKMAGLYAVTQDESTGKYYHSCIIKDATACCAQGIEFVLTTDYKYPEDYPQDGEDITVVGVFNTYQEGDYLYCTLLNARIV